MNKNTKNSIAILSEIAKKYFCGVVIPDQEDYDMHEETGKSKIVIDEFNRERSLINLRRTYRGKDIELFKRDVASILTGRATFNRFIEAFESEIFG